MNTDINNLSKKFNNLNIVPIKKKNDDINKLIISMNKMKIGKKKLIKNNLIKKINTSYELFTLLNKKLFMDEIFGPVLFRHFQKPMKLLKTIPEEYNYDADDSIEEIDE